MKVLVTGGSKCIGKTITTLFKEKGNNVYSPTREELDLTKDFTLVKTDFDINSVKLKQSWFDLYNLIVKSDKKYGRETNNSLMYRP